MLGDHENKNYSDNLKNFGSDGYYRSKSEFIIANMLSVNKLLFKYEPRLVLGGQSIYPDFAVRCRNGQIIFWEHCGMMMSEDYSDRTYRKIVAYARNDITLWDNLVITFDSFEGSIRGDTIQKIIELYCL